MIHKKKKMDIYVDNKILTVILEIFKKLSYLKVHASYH